MIKVLHGEDCPVCDRASQCLVMEQSSETKRYAHYCYACDVVWPTEIGQTLAQTSRIIDHAETLSSHYISLNEARDIGFAFIGVSKINQVRNDLHIEPYIELFDEVSDDWPSLNIWQRWYYKLTLR